jgi:alkaline phosphatase D
MGRRFLQLPPPPVDRRTFLRLGVTGAAGLMSCADEKAPIKSDTANPDSGDSPGTCGPDAATQTGDIADVADGPFTADPFTLGVASGDPLHDRVILWTRLCVEPTDVAATPAVEVELIWELAADDAFTDILQQGVVVATPDLGHAVHVDVDGLESQSVYWYRFRVGAFTSPVGRTKTLPCEDAEVASLRIGFGTCQRYSAGWYVAQRDMAAHDLDLVVFLGDYIYESGGDDVRSHGAPEPWNLDEYRDRYGLYKSDLDLQAAHAAGPWMPIWDDHEVDNNHAGETPSGGASAEEWVARRAAAYRAWYEHQPVRATPPTTDDLRIHRHALFGDLVQIVLLDGRQYRDTQPCGDQIGSRCDEADEDRTMLGPSQEAWFEERLRAAESRWVIIANPVVMMPMDFGGVFLNPDQWDGYPMARQRLLDSITAHASGEPVVFSGDIHASGIGYVPEDVFDPTTPPQVSEFVVPAATSGVDESFAGIGAVLAAQPHISWWDFVKKGWVLVEVGHDRLVARYRLVDDVADAASGIREASAWSVTPGQPGPLPLDE